MSTCVNDGDAAAPLCIVGRWTFSKFVNREDRSEEKRVGMGR